MSDRVHLSAIGQPIVGDPLYGGVSRRGAFLILVAALAAL
jgi:23S rRNA-/tRNA-specific pseudouridylate synthase